MTWKLVGALSVVLLLGPLARAQAPSEAGAPSEPAPRVQTDPETGERYVEVHPTEPLAQGRWPVEAWLVWTVGALGALGAAVFLLRRVRRAPRGR